MVCRIGSFLCLLGAILSCANASADSERRLDTILISKSAQTATVDIRFNCKLRYIDHIPLTESDRARINFTRLDQCGRDPLSSPVRESRRPAGRNLAGIADIEYRDQAGAEGVLLIRFDYPVRLSVRQSGNLKSLRIMVDLPEVMTEKTNPVSSPGIIAAPPVIAAATSNPDLPMAQTPERLERADRMAQQRLDEQERKQAPGLSQGSFAINLESAREPFDADSLAKFRIPPQKEVYTTKVDIDGKAWYRLRMGFFNSEDEANNVRRENVERFPSAWVVKVTNNEIEQVRENLLTGGLSSGLVRGAGGIAPVDVQATNWEIGIASPGLSAEAEADQINPGTSKSTQRELSNEQIAALMHEAADEIVAENYSHAIQIYTKILREPQNVLSPDAQELLGLARERNGQFAHAIAEYRRYLEVYPDNTGADRVQQRLAGLTTAREAPRSELRSASRNGDGESGRWDVYGGLSQYYRRDSIEFDGQEEIVAQSSILTNTDIVARRRGDRIDFSSRATIGNLYDLLSEDEGPGNSTRIYHLYADIMDRGWNLSGRVGRQSIRHSGVLGRFDGLSLSYQWKPETRVNFVTGYPVDSSEDSINTDRFFYGMSMDFTQVLDTVDVSFFYNTQEVDGIEDRQSIGGETRYFDEHRSLLGLIDYDVSFGEVNAFSLFGNWSFDNRLTLNATVDYRNSPYLTIRNALIGQPVTTIEELLLLFSRDEIRQLAEDRTTSYQTYTFGASWPLSPRFQVLADVTMSDFGGTVESGGVPALPDWDTVFYYSVSTVGSSLVKEGDTSIFTLRYADGNLTSTISASADTRYPITRNFRLNPRLRFSLRDIHSDDSDQWILTPSIRLLYRLGRNFSFEFEGGGEWTSRKTEFNTSDTSAYFIYAGYRADF